METLLGKKEYGVASWCTKNFPKVLFLQFSKFLPNKTGRQTNKLKNFESFTVSIRMYSDQNHSIHCIDLGDRK